MGDHWAPTVAQESHENLLMAFGALTKDEHLRLGHILPRSPLGHFSGICVDDKVNLRVVPKHDPHMPLRDSEACAQADNAYAQAGLQFISSKEEGETSHCYAHGVQK